MKIMTEGCVKRKSLMGIILGQLLNIIIWLPFSKIKNKIKDVAKSNSQSFVNFNSVADSFNFINLAKEVIFF